MVAYKVTLSLPLLLTEQSLFAKGHSSEKVNIDHRKHLNKQAMLSFFWSPWCLCVKVLSERITCDHGHESDLKP